MFTVDPRQFETLKQPINIFPHASSQGAIAAIEGSGGTITCIYHDLAALNQAKSPHKYEGKEVLETRPTKEIDLGPLTFPSFHYRDLHV